MMKRWCRDPKLGTQSYFGANSILEFENWNPRNFGLSYYACGVKNSSALFFSSCWRAFDWKRIWIGTQALAHLNDTYLIFCSSLWTLGTIVCAQIFIIHLQFYNVQFLTALSLSQLGLRNVFVLAPRNCDWRKDILSLKWSNFLSNSRLFSLYTNENSIKCFSGLAHLANGCKSIAHTKH